jgi:hypothetical protein
MVMRRRWSLECDGSEVIVVDRAVGAMALTLAKLRRRAECGG